jgi:hypothetical protein
MGWVRLVILFLLFLFSFQFLFLLTLNSFLKFGGSRFEILKRTFEFREGSALYTNYGRLEKIEEKEEEWDIEK